MAIWIEPVSDRTREDVEFAIQKISEWIAGDITYNPLLVYDLKGCLNVSDINRIENDIKYLSEKLNGYAYSVSTSSKSWDSSGVPNESDISRILRNVRAIIAAYHQPKKAPQVPESLLSYTEVNAVEENLALIKELIDAMVKSFKTSGTFTAGSTMFLPIRR